MKTPREILFARHRAVAPKLDALRERAIEGIKEPVREEPMLHRLTASLRGFFPGPRAAWGSLAAAWIVIIVLNVASRETTPERPAARMETKRSSETLQALREQKRLFAEMVGSLSTPDTETPRSIPRPRSERQPAITFV